MTDTLQRSKHDVFVRSPHGVLGVATPRITKGSFAVVVIPGTSDSYVKYEPDYFVANDGSETLQGLLIDSDYTNSVVVPKVLAEREELVAVNREFRTRYTFADVPVSFWLIMNSVSTLEPNANRAIFEAEDREHHAQPGNVEEGLHQHTNFASFSGRNGTWIEASIHPLVTGVPAWLDIFSIAVTPFNIFRAGTHIHPDTPPCFVEVIHPPGPGTFRGATVQYIYHCDEVSNTYVSLGGSPMGDLIIGDPHAPDPDRNILLAEDGIFISYSNSNVTPFTGGFSNQPVVDEAVRQMKKKNPNSLIHTEETASGDWGKRFADGLRQIDAWLN